MRSMRRILSLFVCIALVLSAMVIPVGANQETQTAIVIDEGNIEFDVDELQFVTVTVPYILPDSFENGGYVSLLAYPASYADSVDDQLDNAVAMEQYTISDVSDRNKTAEFVVSMPDGSGKDVQIKMGGTDLQAAAVVDVELPYFDSANLADIDSGVFRYISDAYTVGGVDVNDTLKHAYKEGSIVAQYTVGSGSTKTGSLANYMTDAKTDTVYNNSFDLGADADDTVVMDVIFGNSYEGGRQLEDLFLILKHTADSSKIGRTKVSYSTVANPTEFTQLYVDIKELTMGYSYLRMEDFKQDITNFHTFRFEFSYPVNDLCVCELDINDAIDSASIAAKKTAYENSIKPNSLLTSNMVLQRNEKNKIWGRGGVEGETLTVSFAGQTKTTTVTNGEWEVELDEMSAGGPYDMTISCEGTDDVVFTNILIGEVWLAGGQSNMARSFNSAITELNNPGYTTDDGLPYQAAYPETGATKEGELEKILTDIANSEDDKYRFVHYSYSAAAMSAPYYQLPEVSGVDVEWKEMGPDTTATMSATAYYFGYNLRQKLREAEGQDIPVGIVVSAISGTSARTWISQEVFDEVIDEIDNQEYADKYVGTDETKFYNSMIYPLQKFNFNGVIWYQGCGDAGNPEVYATMFPLLIENWRELFNKPDMPFIFTSLAPFKCNNYIYSRQRESQLKTALTVPNTAMAVITDAGHPQDIHPKDKTKVGLRLAAAANVVAYGSDEVYSGPLYRSMVKDGNTLTLHFAHQGTGMTIGAGADVLRGFEVSADGENFVTANASIVDDTVVVYSDEVADPVAVRYAWNVDNRAITDPIQATLYNNEGFPAVPFRAYVSDLDIRDITLYDENGLEISGDNALNTDVLRFKVKYLNNAYIGSKFVVGLYDSNDMLVGTAVAPVGFNYTNTITTEGSVDVDTSVDGLKAKLMVFEDLESINPITDVIDLVSTNN